MFRYLREIRLNTNWSIVNFRISLPFFKTGVILACYTLRPYSEFFWSVFPAFRLSTDQKNSKYGHFSRSVSTDGNSKLVTIVLKLECKNV